MHHGDDPDTMTFQQLDDLRHRLYVTRDDICTDAGISPSTYHRWRKWSRGEAGGCCPHPRSLGALRAALKARLREPPPLAAGQHHAA